MTGLRQAALVTALITLLSGCSYVKTPVLAFNDDGDYLPRDVGAGLVQSPTPLIPDVPMPVGFKAVRSVSGWEYSQANPQVRMVQHVYQGHARPGDAAAFYQRVLPMNQWTLMDIQAIDDITTLRYTKGAESLSVTLGQGWGITTVTININAR